MKENKFLYNPRTYTLSAMIIGYILIRDYTANEQNAIGNWLMTAGQILEANAAIQMAIEDKFQGYTYNINSKEFKKGGSPYMNNKPLIDIDSKELESIKKSIKDLINKINNLNI